MADILGIDVDVAAAIADGVLRSQNPDVVAAMSIWYNVPETLMPSFDGWLAQLPESVHRGEYRSADADQWVRRASNGLIEQLGPVTAIEPFAIAASAIATKVTWVRPFATAPAARLGARSSWASELSHVFITELESHNVLSSTTKRIYAHTQFITSEPEVGDVIVHAAQSHGGLIVVSIAVDRRVPAQHVVAVAHDIAVKLASGDEVPRRSLFDLAIGETELWTISEDEVETTGETTRVELVRTLIPAWSARSEHRLLEQPDLGFDIIVQSLSFGRKLASRWSRDTDGAASRRQPCHSRVSGARRPFPRWHDGESPSFGSVIPSPWSRLPRMTP